MKSSGVNMKKFVILCTLLVAAAAFSVKKIDWNKVHEDDISFKDFPAINLGPRIEGRIAGGQETKPHEFPYQAGIYMLLSPAYPGAPEVTAWCGGALISTRVVLTAAHCLANTEKGILVLGAHNLEDHNEEGRQTIQVTPKDFVIHTGYSESNPVDDIALIILPQEAQINDYVQTVNIPKHDSFEPSYEGTIGYVTGWGLTGDSVNDGPSKVLRVAHSRILPDSSCRGYFPNMFHSTQICVSGMDRTSACSGDSGGPLVLPGWTHKTVIGLVSFGRKEGCQKGYPSVYTKVYSYLNWIQLQTGITGNE